jgi:hypothetical protein
MALIAGKAISRSAPWLGAWHDTVTGIERSDSTFFYPDYTVGPGFSPGPALRLAGLAHALPPIGNFTLP